MTGPARAGPNFLIGSVFSSQHQTTPEIYGEKRFRGAVLIAAAEQGRQERIGRQSKM
jgi:hypothetical protein